MYRSTRFRIVAIALAFAISVVTLGLATPGAAVYVADRIAPPAGDAFERIAGAREGAAIEVDILPPGITIDPDREDNPEVILAELPEGLNGPEDPAIPDALKGRYAAEGAEPLREPLKEVFSTPGKPGAIYTLDFRKGSKNLRVRVFYVQAKGKLVSLTVSGETSRLTAREPALRAIAASLDYAP